MREIATRIRRTREFKGLPATEIARQVGVSRPYYSLLETGKRRLSAEHVWKIARALGVSVAELYGEMDAQDRTEHRPTLLRPGEHMHRINRAALHKRLRPLLREQTDDTVEWIEMMAGSPEPLRSAVKAFCESYRNAS